MDNIKNNPKNLLYWAASLALVVGALCTLWYVSAYARTTTPEGSWNTFTVSAEGKAVAVPDIGKISFSVVTEAGKDFAAAQADNTKKMNEITTFLKDAGVSEDDIKTTSYSISPRMSYFPCTGMSCRAPETTGYTISQSVEVKVRDLAKSGEIIAGATERGANGVSGPSFVVDDESKARDEARAEAIAKAKEKAETVAEQSGLKLGKLISVTEDTAGMPQPYYGMGGAEMGGMMSKAVDAAPSFQPGTQDVTVYVTLTYSTR